MLAKYLHCLSAHSVCHPQYICGVTRFFVPKDRKQCLPGIPDASFLAQAEHVCVPIQLSRSCCSICQHAVPIQSLPGGCVQLYLAHILLILIALDMCQNFSLTNSSHRCLHKEACWTYNLHVQYYTTPSSRTWHLVSQCLHTFPLLLGARWGTSKVLDQGADAAMA